MQVNLSRGVIGRAGINWGTTEAGLPVCLVESGAVNVRIVFDTPDEATTFGQQAIFLGMSCALERGGSEAVRPASLLVDVTGNPL